MYVVSSLNVFLKFEMSFVGLCELICSLNEHTLNGLTDLDVRDIKLLILTM